MGFERSDAVFDVPSFAAGFLDSPEEDSIPPGGTRDAKNCLLINISTQDLERAILRKRNGSRLLNPVPIATAKGIDGMFSFQTEGGLNELVVVCNGTAYKWDGAAGFVALPGGTGFTVLPTAAPAPLGYTVGHTVNFLAFKNNLFIMDGVQQLRYNGTTCFPVGGAAPTGPVALGITAGPGVTGTYEGYWVGYDPVLDHETSPTPYSAQVVFANQARIWTRPAHTLPANYTFWRVYVRRVDTSEANYFRVGTVAIGTATLTETVIDIVRRDIGPGPNTNDPPPVFAFAEEFKGYRLGVPLNSSVLWVSKIGDPESQHIKDQFPVGGKGDTKPIRSVRKFGNDCILRKPTRSYRLVGDRLPFAIEPITSSLGGVSQTSGMEIDGWWYEWDQERGPYRTNLSEWQTLGNTRIERVLDTVNRQELHKITCEHHKDLNLLVWAVPLHANTHKTLLLKFNYKLNRWLPPDTGLEYGRLAGHTTGAGIYGVYMGDEWGRVYRLYDGETEGVPSGTTDAAITGAAADVISCAAAAFYTTSGGLAGMPAMLLSPTGATQWVRIRSNTATQLTLDVDFNPGASPVPPGDGTWRVIVGGIDWYWWTPRFTGGDPFTKKAAGWIYVQGATDAATTRINLALRFNRQLAIERSYYFTFSAGGLVWGAGLWGEPWGAAGDRQMKKQRLPHAYFDVSFKFFNYYPAQPVELTAVRATADWLRRRKAGSW